jgi:CheY-like chemotaxis protein
MSKIPHVLLVDDSEVDNKFHEIVIKQTGAPVGLKAIADSNKAIEYLEKGINPEGDDETPVPDIVFLDINMPAINGYELLDRFRKIPDPYKRKRGIKFFILSSSPGNTPIITKTYGDLIVKYLVKPLTADAFMDVLNTCLVHH